MIYPLINVMNKTNYKHGLVSDYLLWKQAFDDEISTDEHYAMKLRMACLKNVREISKQYFDDTIDMSDHLGFEYIDIEAWPFSEQKPIANFKLFIDENYAVIDLLYPSKFGAWNLVTVSSSTQTKEKHIHDLAYIKYALEQSDIVTNRLLHLHVNKEFVKNGPIKATEFLKLEDVTESVLEASENIAARIQHMKAVLDLDTAPTLDLKDLYKADADCKLRKDFKLGLPKYNIFELAHTHFHKQLDKWMSGTTYILDLDKATFSSPKHAIQYEAIATGKPQINTEKIKAFVDTIQYPIYHLDFETYNGAVPKFEGMRPYQQLPFQFSLHIENQDGSIAHIEYLHQEKTDPRPAILDLLSKHIGDKGTILCYNDGFEKRVIEDLIQFDQAYTAWGKSAISRLKDLATPFRNYDYYDKDQFGSYSLKTILPLLTDESYGGMYIQDGNAAMYHYFTYILSDYEFEDEENGSEKIFSWMKAYCKKDTWAMVLILRKLKMLTA